MRTSTKLLRLCVVVPAGLAGSFVAVIALGFLPDAGLSVAFLGTLLVSLVLACGWWEGPASRLLGASRGLRPGQRTVLEPTLVLLGKLDLAPDRVLIRLYDNEGLPATPIGRRTVIVEPWLVQGLYERRLTPEDAAAAIGHAVASQRVGPYPFDLAARLWALPWTLVFVGVRQIARIFSWVPAGGFAWHLRIVVGVVAVLQGFQPGGDPVLGIAAGVLVAVSYVAPAADLAWRSVVQRDADRLVAQHGLARSLIHLAQWQHGSASLERVQRIRAEADEEKVQRGNVGASATDERGGALVLAHPAAQRRNIGRTTFADHELHLEADLFFGPCNDPNCVGRVPASRESRPDLAWPTRDHLRLIEDVDP